MNQKGKKKNPMETEIHGEKRRRTRASAVIAVGLWGKLHVLFNGVKWDNKASIFMNEESAPDGHFLNSVLFNLRTLLKKDSDIVTKWTGGSDRRSGVAEGLESKKFRPSLSLLAGFED